MDLTHQRNANRTRIIRLSLELYDQKSEAEKRRLFEHHVNHIAVEYSIHQQEDWIRILENSVAVLKGGE